MSRFIVTHPPQVEIESKIEYGGRHMPLAIKAVCTLIACNISHKETRYS